MNELNHEEKQKLFELFDQLHSHPERSGEECQTSRLIRCFMEMNTGMEYHELPGGFYYVYRSAIGKQKILVRADLDAVSVDAKSCAHLCGHDGHSSSLCCLALLLERYGSENDVYLLFQASEENGQGALGCLEVLNEPIDLVYGCHNLPGMQLGRIYVREDTFACTSCGLVLHLQGKSSHAAYPENGISPSHLTAQLLLLSERYQDLNKMVTVISCRMGEMKFGVMAHEAQICLTLRSIRDDLLKELKEQIIAFIEENKGELVFTYEELDFFPATMNHKEAVDRIRDRLDADELPEPMRWSEDFGYYLQKKKGAFFGIGSGIDNSGLHTADYRYPKELIERTGSCFYDLVK